jgi:hypothetical protein
VGVSHSTHVTFEEMPAELQELLSADTASTGHLGEFFERAAHQPDALIAFCAWTDALRDALPPRLVQTIALTVTTHTRSGTERAQQERAALAVGMTREEVRALERMRAGTCPSFSDEEVAAAALARCLLEDFGCGCESALLRLSRLIGEAATTACLMLAARHVASATMANAWTLRAPAAEEA